MAKGANALPAALKPLPISCLPFLVPTAAAPVPAATVSGKILPASVPSAAAVHPAAVCCC